MSKLHIFLLIDPSLRFLLKKLANTKYVDAWELWTQCKEPGYIYIYIERKLYRIHSFEAHRNNFLRNLSQMPARK
jgi:hypothetical protein